MNALLSLVAFGLLSSPSSLCTKSTPSQPTKQQQAKQILLQHRQKGQQNQPSIPNPPSSHPPLSMELSEIAKKKFEDLTVDDVKLLLELKDEDLRGVTSEDWKLHTLHTMMQLPPMLYWLDQLTAEAVAKEPLDKLDIESVNPIDHKLQKAFELTNLVRRKQKSADAEVNAILKSGIWQAYPFLSFIRYQAQRPVKKWGHKDAKFLRRMGSALNEKAPGHQILTEEAERLRRAVMADGLANEIWGLDCYRHKLEPTDVSSALEALKAFIDTGSYPTVEQLATLRAINQLPKDVFDDYWGAYRRELQRLLRPWDEGVLPVTYQGPLRSAYNRFMTVVLGSKTKGPLGCVECVQQAIEALQSAGNDLQPYLPALADALRESDPTKRAQFAQKFAWFQIYNRMLGELEAEPCHLSTALEGEGWHVRDLMEDLYVASCHLHNLIPSKKRDDMKAFALNLFDSYFRPKYIDSVAKQLVSVTCKPQDHTLADSLSRDVKQADSLVQDAKQAAQVVCNFTHVFHTDISLLTPVQVLGVPKNYAKALFRTTLSDNADDVRRKVINAWTWQIMLHMMQAAPKQELQLPDKRLDCIFPYLKNVDLVGFGKLSDLEGSLRQMAAVWVITQAPSSNAQTPSAAKKQQKALWLQALKAVRENSPAKWKLNSVLQEILPKRAN
jgi:hypothetical protein